MTTREEYFAKTPWPGRGRDAGRQIAPMSVSEASSRGSANPAHPDRFAKKLTSELRPIALHRAGSYGSDATLSRLCDYPEGTPGSIPPSVREPADDRRKGLNHLPGQALGAARFETQSSFSSRGSKVRWQPPTRAVLEKASDNASLRARSPGTVSLCSTIRNFLVEESEKAPSQTGSMRGAADMNGRSARHQNLYRNLQVLPPTLEDQRVDFSLNEKGRRRKSLKN
mmetsp:Transcript_62848/g.99725  ORF Transcript_62848/g.99725 Transcript_62848/m.99725 type:complete len:226 (+) Transcript_62848:14-691(+)